MALLLKGPFTVDDYYRMEECGILAPDERTELLDGQIISQPPMSPEHAACVNRLARLLFAAVGNLATVTVQTPIRLNVRSEPQPDLTLARFRKDGYSKHHPVPEDLFLLIEVMVSSEDYDREIKLPLYARAGIAEVWLVNLNENWVEIHREPVAGEYTVVRRATDGGTMAPHLLPASQIPVAEILS